VSGSTVPSVAPFVAALLSVALAVVVEVVAVAVALEELAALAACVPEPDALPDVGKGTGPIVENWLDSGMTHFNNNGPVPFPFLGGQTGKSSI
jgi:hypothetical protein